MNENLMIIQIILQAQSYDGGVAISIILGIVISVVVGLISYALTRKNRKVSFAMIGAILGIPLSYYFQNELVKLKVGGIGGYITNFDQIFNNGNLLGNVILSVIIFAIIGAVIGYFVDNSEAKKKL